MDIRIHGPEADGTERAVVDSVLGSLARPPRDLLLPALHAVQDRFGWLKPGALNYICSRMDLPPADVFGVATFYHLFSLSPAPERVVHVCDDIACRIQGAETICSELEKSGITWKRSPCLGQCERAPAALVMQSGESPAAYAIDPRQNGTNGSVHHFQHFTENDRLLRRIGKVDPGSVEDYEKDNGYV